ncbi:antA/AntB antirepressor family protein [Tepidicaulis sp. LMO-SS28]|uniref:antA/AntB antirepressor family protein n=1 Tax=Tepidicaulis sp. LMO-SS28 TaxID=3447455 RepID=UPI003EDE9F1A
MDPLIPITTQQVADDAVQTVNARELHAVLGVVGKDFTTWIKGRIGECGFVEETDLSDEEIAQRLEKVMDLRIPQWVARNRRFLAEGRRMS